MDFIIHRGGPCIPECLPVCEGCNETTRARHTPYPTKVAGEYHRSNFTLGWTFNPAQIEYQRRGIECAPAGLAVDDFVSMILVPAEHTIRDILVEIGAEQTLYATSSAMPNINHLRNNQVGFEISVEIRRFTREGTLLGTSTVPATLQGLDSPPVPSGSAAQAKLVVRAAISPTTAGLFIEQGQYAEVGFVIDALPTANPYGPAGTPFPMEMMSGYVKLVAHVDGYDAPIHG